MIVVFPAVATVLGAAFALATWRSSETPAMRVWAFALVQFAVAAGALWWGVTFGWTPSSYRVFYLAGAVTNVAWLGLGTVYLFAPRAAASATALAVLGASIYAGVRVVGAPLALGALRHNPLPPPSAVMPGGVRALSRWFSIGGSVVVLAGLALSIARRRHRLGLALLALGVVVVGLAGELARAGYVAQFSALLAAGIGIMYAGFLRTRPAPVP